MRFRNLTRWMFVAVSLAVVAPAALLAPRAVADDDVVKVDDSDNYEQVFLPQGGRLHVRLTANATTGYRWRLVSGAGDVLKPLDDGVYRPPRRGMPGAAGHTVFRFDARKAGTTTLTFRYAQVGSGNQGRAFTVFVTVRGPEPKPGRVVVVDDSDNREQVIVGKGKTLQVNLKANATTGYSWRILRNDPSALRPMGDPEYTPFPNDGRVGVGGVTTLRFRAERSGLYDLVLAYRQAQNPGRSGKTFQIQVWVP